ncbi:hypothetical protein BH20VER3_BH20VER3_00550 [soil metagenome]
MSEPTNHRFPKWLLDETFTISHDSQLAGFTVTLYRTLKEGDQRFSAEGPSIALAAKRALAARQATPRGGGR